MEFGFRMIVYTAIGEVDKYPVQRIPLNIIITGP